MKIDETELYEFMKLYEDEFGEDISLNDAKEMAERIAELYEVLARPLPSETNTDLEKDQDEVKP